LQGLYILRTFRMLPWSHFYLQKSQCLLTRHVPFSLSWIMGSSSLLRMGLSVFICWFHNIVILRSLLVSPDFSACAYQCSFPNFILISLHIVKWSWAHSILPLYVLLVYQYWVCWYSVAYCLDVLFIIIFPVSASDCCFLLTIIIIIIIIIIITDILFHSFTSQCRVQRPWALIRSWSQRVIVIVIVFITITFILYLSLLSVLLGIFGEHIMLTVALFVDNPYLGVKLCSL
jgi:hypothetical protein